MRWAALIESADNLNRRQRWTLWAPENSLVDCLGISSAALAFLSLSLSVTPQAVPMVNSEAAHSRIRLGLASFPIMWANFLWKFIASLLNRHFGSYAWLGGLSVPHLRQKMVTPKMNKSLESINSRLQLLWKVESTCHYMGRFWKWQDQEQLVILTNCPALRKSKIE